MARGGLGFAGILVRRRSRYDLALRSPPLPMVAFESSRIFSSGERIADRYTLRKRIAVGGMAEIWLARNAATHGEVALKLLRRGGESPYEEELVQRFRNEAHLSVSLSHRNMVKIYDLIEDRDGTLALVMELLRGESVFTRLARGKPIDPGQAIFIAGAVLDALDHAHDRGIVHRDVTPANVFLAADPDGQVIPKLLDFGLAKATSARVAHGVRMVQTIDGRALGTPKYMAPERIRGTDVVDPRSDLFAVSVVLYEMLTTVSPFDAETPAACLAAVLERHVDPDPRIDPRVWLEISRGLSKQAYERHGSARELSEALRKAAADARLPCDPMSLTEPGYFRPKPAEVLDASVEAPWDAHGARPPHNGRKVLAVVATLVGIVGLGVAGRRVLSPRQPLAQPPVPVSQTVASALMSQPPSAPSPAASASARPAEDSVVRSVTASPAASSSKASRKTSPGPASHPKPVATSPGF
jgi:serine/threonine protein kinase